MKVRLFKLIDWRGAVFVRPFPRDEGNAEGATPNATLIGRCCAGISGREDSGKTTGRSLRATVIVLIMSGWVARGGGVWLGGRGRVSKCRRPGVVHAGSSRGVAT